MATPAVLDGARGLAMPRATRRDPLVLADSPAAPLRPPTAIPSKATLAFFIETIVLTMIRFEVRTTNGPFICIVLVFSVISETLFIPTIVVLAYPSILVPFEVGVIPILVGIRVPRMSTPPKSTAPLAYLLLPRVAIPTLKPSRAARRPNASLGPSVESSSLVLVVLVSTMLRLLLARGTAIAALSIAFVGVIVVS